MLSGVRELTRAAAAQGHAVGAFTAYNLEQADAVLAAAAAAGASAMLLVSSQSFCARSGAGLIAALRVLAERSRVPCALQLDHETDLGRIEAALDAGATAVMADGSKLPYEDNVAFVRAATALAGLHGASVECELGHVAGDEEMARAVERGGLTDPEQAVDFVARTGAECLAVSIGNVHGTYLRPPQLDWERLEQIRDRVPVALSLHGASGIPDRDVRRAVAAGITKVNVNTELRQRWFAVLGERAATLADGAQLLKLQDELTAAVERVAALKIALLSGD